MSLAGVEQRLETLLAQTPVATIVEPRRLVQFAEYATIGATGAAIDLTITATTLDLTHYLLANLLGFLVANTWNFTWNHRITFNNPSGSLRRQYPAYLGWHLTTFAVRAIVITLLIETAGVPILVASAIGIGAAAIANFLASERIFDPEAYRVDVVAAINRLAHRLYHSRLRQRLRTLGLYPLVYTGYQHLIGHLHRPDTITVTAASTEATLHTEHAPETVSILHTIEKEQAILDQFLTDLEPTDRVWDVGANLGVFTTLAADQVADVQAFEPYPATADRLQENLALNNADNAGVHAIALGNTDEDIDLSVERHELGTQTPTTTRAGTDTITVPQLPGDTVDAAPPTVLKVDVEGAEASVLEGLSQTLDECVRLVYVETHDATFHTTDSSPRINDQLARHGFIVDVLEDGDQTYVRGRRDP